MEQDRARNVKEIMLEQCNGTTAWQLSLVQAIESASPFPAPPDAAVFSEKLTLQMTADGYVDGQPADGYEPARENLQNGSGASAQEALEAAIAQLRPGNRATGGVVELRIEGQPGAVSIPPGEPGPAVAGDPTAPPDP